MNIFKWFKRKVNNFNEVRKKEQYIRGYKDALYFLATGEYTVNQLYALNYRNIEFNCNTLELEYEKGIVCGIEKYCELTKT